MGILFESDAVEFNEAKDRIARIPKGISTKADLLGALALELDFPDHFGRNWDALSDCLGDFSWMTRGRVIIVHDDVPPMDSKSQAIYLRILSDAVDDWKTGEVHQLIVVFPGSSKDQVGRLLQSESGSAP